MCSMLSAPWSPVTVTASFIRGTSLAPLIRRVSWIASALTSVTCSGMGRSELTSISQPSSLVLLVKVTVIEPSGAVEMSSGRSRL